MKTLKNGDSGIPVTWLQYALNIMCCSITNFDGVFGAETVNAVMLYQSKYDLSVDGIAGPATQQSLSANIKNVQEALTLKGYYPYAANGVAKVTLYNAVINFQKDNNLPADGKVGAATWRKLRSNTVETPESTGLPMQLGAIGGKVPCVQYALLILCCHPGGADGTFGEKTETAVKAFQSRYGIAPIDGIVTTIVWSKMVDEISRIQAALISHGIDVGIVDGIAGPLTLGAITEFQEQNNLTADGMVGNRTRVALFGTAAEDSANDAFPLQKGSVGPNVLHLQYGLRIVCINPYGTDGAFGNGTENAVKRFQQNNNLTQTGIVDDETWEMLCSKVKPVQQALANQGKDVGTVNGIPTELVYNAVLEFQTENGLTADGMVGSSTNALLIGNSGNTGTTSSTLRLGSNGSLTRYYKRLLYKLGYLPSMPMESAAMSYFGSDVHNATISFQTAHGLTADGVVGSGTWNKIFELYHVDVAGTGLDKFINIAWHEVSWGFCEDNSNNITPYGQWYNSLGVPMNGSPWCAMFVSWCAHHVGNSFMGTTVPQFASCEAGKVFYINNNRYKTSTSGYEPFRGDLIFFTRYRENGTMYIGHVGIVVDYNRASKLVYTVEGNSSDRVESKTYNLGDSSIAGYGCNNPAGDYGTSVDYYDDKRTKVNLKANDILSAFNLDPKNWAFNFTEELTYGVTPKIVIASNPKVTLQMEFRNTYSCGTGENGLTLSVSKDGFSLGSNLSSDNVSVALSKDIFPMATGIQSYLETFVANLSTSIGDGKVEISLVAENMKVGFDMAVQASIEVLGIEETAAYIIKLRLEQENDDSDTASQHQQMCTWMSTLQTAAVQASDDIVKACILICGVAIFYFVVTHAMVASATIAAGGTIVAAVTAFFQQLLLNANTLLTALQAAQYVPA